MNKARRNELAKIKDVIEIERGKLQIVCEEEQDTMMNIPENLQEGERYYDMETYIESMEEALEHLDDVIDILDEMI